MGFVVTELVVILFVFVFLLTIIGKLCKAINKGDFVVKFNFWKFFQIHIEANLTSHNKNDK